MAYNSFKTRLIVLIILYFRDEYYIEIAAV